MIRMLMVGYCMGIRSERRLCEEVHLNLAYRWFCRLGLGGKVPDHSTFSKNRHGRFRESDLLRHMLESVVQRCMAEGLVGADGFAVDAGLIAADANKRRSVPSKDWKPEEIKENAVRAAREYLSTLDDAASPVTPKFISRSDPAAQWTGAHKGPAFLRYVLPRRFRLRSRTRPLHVPCRQGTGPVSAHLRNPRSGVTAEGTRLYRASKLDCDVCKLKQRCCPNALARKIPRDLHEDARDVARAHAATPEYVEACRRRKKVGMLFAHLKRILRLTRLRLRGPNGANDEFLLAATAQNLRRLARLRPTNMLPERLAA
jgi:hypothetical protein